MAVSPERPTVLRRRGSDAADDAAVAVAGAHGNATPERRTKRQKIAGSKSASMKPAAKPSATDDSADVAAYAAMHRAHYRSMEEEKGVFSKHAFWAPRRNAAQKDTFKQIMKLFISVVAILIAANFVFLPGSAHADCIDTAAKMFSVDNLNSHIYWIAGKIGAAGNGAARVAEYIAKYAEKGMACPLIVSLIDIDNLSAAVQVEVTEAILKGISRFLPRALPMTIEDALRLDMNGINVFAQIFFWSMVKAIDECTILGGAMELISCLRRLYLAVFESGLQEHLRKEGKVAVRGRAHEMLRWNPLGWFLCADEEVNDAVRTTVRKLPWTLQQLREAGLHNLVVSWAPAKSDTLPENCKGLTCCMADLLMRFKERWANIFSRPPVENSKNIDQRYASEEYTEDDCEDAVDVFGSKVEPVETYGGVIGLNKNKKAFSVKDTTAIEYMKARRPFGEEGPRWEEFDTFLKLTVMILVVPEHNVPRIALIYPPFCFALFWKSGIKITWTMLTKMKDTIMAAQFMLVFFRVCEDESYNLDNLDRLDRSLFDSLLFPWALFIYLNQALHLCDTICTLFFKNWIDDVANQFGRGYTGKRRWGEYTGEDDGGLTFLVSKNSRIKVTNPNKSNADVAVRRNRFLPRSLVTVLSRVRVPADLRPRLDDWYAMLEEDAVGNAAADSSKCVRYSNFIASGVISGPLETAAVAKYKGSLKNGGNTSGNQYSVTREQMDGTTAHLRHYADLAGTEEGKFFVQCQGSAEQPNPHNGDDDETPFVTPDDGDMLDVDPNPPKGQRWTARDRVAFRRDAFVPGITFRGLQQRTVPLRTSGNTNAMQAEKFTEYKVCWTRGIFRYSSRTIHYVNDRNVVEVWFERK